MGRKLRKVKSDSEDSDVEIGSDKNDEDVPALTIKSLPCSNKLFFVPNRIESVGWENIVTVSLPHPCSGNPALFLVDSSKGATDSSQFLFEVLTYEQPLRSWFIDDHVVSDGNLRVLTQVDPLFLILPIIKKSSQARPLSDHLCDDLSPHIAEIFCHRVTEKQLENITTRKQVDDLVVYLYSEACTLSWLAKKVEKTSAFLSQRNIARSEASISSNFTISSTESKQDDNEYLRYGCDIIGDYLEDDLRKKLLAKLGLPAEPDRKRKTEGIVGEHDGLATAKKSKMTESKNNVKPLEDYGSDSLPTPPKGPIGKAKKDLEKAAKGTASLFKFFAPKAKATE